MIYLAITNRGVWFSLTLFIACLIILPLVTYLLNRHK